MTALRIMLNHSLITLGVLVVVLPYISLYLSVVFFVVYNNAELQVHQLAERMPLINVSIYKRH